MSFCPRPSNSGSFAKFAAIRPRRVPTEHLGCQPPTGLLVVIEIAKLLPGAVVHDVADAASGTAVLLVAVIV